MEEYKVKCFSRKITTVKMEVIEFGFSVGSEGRGCEETRDKGGKLIW